MKRILMSALIILTVFQFSYGQNLVSQVNWQLDDSEEKILISYDLEKDGSYRYLDVSVKVYIDNNALIPKALSGDVGTYIRAGKQKQIIWDVFRDVVELSGELTIEVIATSPKITTPDPSPVSPSVPVVRTNKVPLYAGLGGVVTLGGGLVVAGLSQESNSKDLYKTYESVQDPSDAVYNELTRQEHYDEANSKHKTSSWMTYGGLAVIATGGFILVKRLIDIKKWENTSHVSLKPEIGFDAFPASHANSSNANLKLKLTYNF